MSRNRFNPRPYQALEQKLKVAITKSLDEAAAKTLQMTNDNFRNKSFFGERWIPNTTGTPTLVKSANLKNSIRIQSRTHNMRRIGTNVKYASIHNEGIVYKASKRQENFFWAEYKRTGDTVFKNSALKIKSGGSITIPKRQFLGRHQKLDQAIIRIIKKNLLNIK